MFGALLGRPAFRSDLLYFTRLAGNYAASIYVDVRNRAPMKHRKALDTWLASQRYENNLQQQLADHARWFDPFKRDFAVCLGEMPPYMRERMGRALQHDHALPLDNRAFIACLDDLRDYRHWLEHYGEDTREQRTPRPPSDERLLDILGLMLLPFLSAHLAGRVHHHARRIRLRGTTTLVQQVRTKMAAAIISRREASKYINGLKARVDHDSIRDHLTTHRGNPPHDSEVHKIAAANKKLRADLEQQKAAMLDLHRRYFAPDHWPRYNYENFLIRFGFIGRGRIAELEELLRAGRDPPEPLDFILHIEPLFMLSMDIALIIHVWLSELEALGVPIKDTKKLGKAIGPDQAKTLVAIRNAIAHGGWVWSVTPKGAAPPLSFGELLTALFAALDHPKVNDKAARRNDLLTVIEGALRPCQWARVYDKSPPPG